MIKLDSYWIFDKDMRCPNCGKKGIWNDTHNDMDATHYCKGCKESMCITMNVRRRGEE